MSYLDPVNPPSPVRGNPTRVQQASVITVNPDGTVDLRPVNGRATKVGVPVIAHYVPTIGDVVYYADLDGDPMRPVIVEVLAVQHRPVITGSRSTDAPLQQLLGVLADLGLIVDETTP